MKDTNNYLLSVVVPTKNREYYANLAIRQILSICGDDVQVVVQDNGDNDQLEKLLADIREYNNLVYHHTTKLLSFVENFDQALQLASGKYITMIGDDDGITSELYKATLWAERNGFKAIKSNLNIVYFWPGSKVFSKNDDGILKITSSMYTIKKASSRRELKKLLNNSCQDYLNMNLVKIYHGIVRRDVLEKIKEKKGKYVGGLSPDIYLSVALTALLDGDVEVIDAPLTISGICNASGSSASATGAHTGKLEDAPHFRGHDSYVWKKSVPKFYSVETIWADSALEAIEDICPEYENEYRLEQIVDVTMKKYPQYKGIITKTYKDYKGSNIKLLINRIHHKALRLCRGVKNRVHKRMRKEWNSVIDIMKASEIVENEFKGKKSIFD